MSTEFAAPAALSTPVSMRELVDAGCHFGHQTRRWHPAMKPFLYGERNGIHIIDLSFTLPRLRERDRLRGGHRRAGRARALRRHQAPGVRHGRGARGSRGHAVRPPPLAGRHAHQLPHDPEGRGALQGADRAARRGSARRSPQQEGALAPGARAPQAPQGLRGHLRHGARARRDRADRHQVRGDRAHRGAAPRHPGDRDRRLELRPARHRVRDPGQRRRDPRDPRSTSSA